MTTALLSGVLLALEAVAALLFFRAFTRTADRLFALFGFAFVALAGERLLLALTDRPEANDPLSFIPRLAAFVLIIWAIVDRNRR
ncbi:MAG TPA: DUF5985 family protein [Candidatus Baltobacteraceae bacterium]|nr:DUF5985 family protein [Candidatus Baltobacteraceae bacterium]